MRRVFRQTLRGIGTLPHVGEHPGTLVLGMSCVAGVCATANWVGGLIMLLVLGPIYLAGAYYRAEDSDRYGRADQ